MPKEWYFEIIVGDLYEVRVDSDNEEEARQMALDVVDVFGNLIGHHKMVSYMEIQEEK